MTLKSEHQLRVEKFMRLADQNLPESPTEPDEATRLLRAKLIFEECVNELIHEGLGVGIRVVRDVAGCAGAVRFDFEIIGPFNMEKTIDGCCDGKVVITGTLSACGVPDEPFQKLIDENNLAKFGPGGYRADGTSEKPGPAGKWIKPPGHQPPDIAGLLHVLPSLQQ